MTERTVHGTDGPPDGGVFVAALLFVGCVLIWGTTWYGIHLQDNGTPATAAVAVRFLLAAALMWGLTLVSGQRVVLPSRRWPLVACYGLSFFCINYLLVYLGTQTVPSGLVAVLFSTTIFFNVVLEVLMLRRFPGWSALTAALLGCAGLALLFEREILSGAIDASGAMLVIAAAVVGAIGNILAARLLHDGVPILELSTTGMSAGAVAMALYALVRGDFARMVFDTPFVLSLVYLAVFGSVVAFTLYFMLMRRIGPTRAAYSTVFFPLVALLISAWFENYVMRPLGWLGVALLIAGALLAIGRPRAVPD